MLLQCVKKDLKITQDVLYHILNEESIPRCLVIVTCRSPKPGASKYF